MILLDTHIWVWWVHGDAQLTQNYSEYIQQQESQGLGVSAISCWEVAKLVERDRLMLPCPVEEWLNQALAYPGVCLLVYLCAIAYRRLLYNVGIELPVILHSESRPFWIALGVRLKLMMCCPCN